MCIRDSLGLEYRAGWESTFLDAARVRALLGFALAPAAWLTGIALPDVARLEACLLYTSPRPRDRT